MKNAIDFQNRRKFLRIVGAASVATPFVALLGCGGGSSENMEERAEIETETEVEMDTEDTTNANFSTEIDSSRWASGGTSSISVDFPPESPFSDSDSMSVCTPETESYTLGPCYFSVEDFQEDISDGEPGVPSILALKLVDQDCNAISGANIEVWHCDAEGIYSGDTSGSSDTSSWAGDFCTGGDNAAEASKWFRGVQTTDSDGVVYFKTCFPGWYGGRTTHIHFRVFSNGTVTKISQFGYDDALCNDIYLSHDDYTGRQKDTTNSSDNIFGNSSADEFEFTVGQYEDGTMLAYRTIQIQA